MDSQEYQDEAYSTAIYGESVQDLIDVTSDVELDSFLRLTYVSLKLNGEAGEFAELVGKMLRDDKGKLTTERRDKLIKELGDVQWYVSACCIELGISLGALMLENLDKLATRAREGKLHGSGSNR